MNLDAAIEEIKQEMGLVESAKAVRDGLDEMVAEVLDRVVNPGRWPEKAGKAA